MAGPRPCSQDIHRGNHRPTCRPGSPSCPASRSRRASCGSSRTRAGIRQHVRPRRFPPDFPGAVSGAADLMVRSPDLGHRIAPMCRPRARDATATADDPTSPSRDRRRRSAWWNPAFPMRTTSRRRTHRGHGRRTHRGHGRGRGHGHDGPCHRPRVAPLSISRPVRPPGRGCAARSRLGSGGPRRLPARPDRRAANPGTASRGRPGTCRRTPW